MLLVIRPASYSEGCDEYKHISEIILLVCYKKACTIILTTLISMSAGIIVNESPVPNENVIAW